jgi:hypothetical protein
VAGGDGTLEVNYSNNMMAACTSSPEYFWFNTDYMGLLHDLIISAGNLRLPAIFLLWSFM